MKSQCVSMETISRVEPAGWFRLRIWPGLRPAVFVVLLLAFALNAVGQEHPAIERGFDPAKLYQFSELDSINLFSGGLSIHLPIGGSYPVGGGLSYGLTLVYSSKAWDFRFEQPVSPGSSSATRTVPSRFDNAGFGWSLQMGALIDPDDGPGFEDPYIRWNYVDPSGGRHAFYVDPENSSVSYSRDSSYLRMKVHAASASPCAAPDPLAPTECRTVEHPNGQIHEFHDFGSTGNHDWRLTRIRDPFANAVDISYAVPGKWIITDQHGRTHTVLMTSLSVDGETRQFVKSVELAAFGTTMPAVYTFTYVSKDIRPGCTDTYHGPTSTVPVQLLESLILPDGSKFQIGGTGYTGGCSGGLLTALELPTGGRIEYGYSSWHIPMTCNDGITEWAERSPGVRTRRFFDLDGSLEGEWLYDHDIGPPVPAPILCTDPLVDGPSEYKTTTVTAPDGHRTRHYFSAWPHAIPVGGSPSGFRFEEYALPFDRRDSVAGQGKTLYLSSESEQCNGAVCEVIRRTYVEYEQGGSCSAPGDTPETDCDRRLRSQRTVYVDDAGRFVESDSSDFDGLGHYRLTRVSGDFPAGSQERFTYTNFNPGRGSTDDGSFSRPRADEPWILGTFDQQWVEEGGKRAFTSSCFDLDTGLLLGQRRYRQLGSAAGPPPDTTDDLLSLFGYVGGNLVSERHYGGDVHAVPSAVFVRSSGDCRVSDPASAPAYRKVHDYDSGSLKSSRFVEPANGTAVVLQTLDLTIDANTGLAESSREPNGVVTHFEYDPMGRLTARKPHQTAWTTYDYQTAATPPHIIIRRQSSAAPFHQKLTEGRLEYDGLGRLVREQQELPKPGGGTHWANTEIRYDGLGRKWKESVTVALTASGLPLPGDTRWTTFDYDALGRVTTTTVPDGSIATARYTGPRIVERTVMVDGSPSTTTETYDIHGRLITVSEPSGVGANGLPVDVATDYGYDFADRLTSVSMNSGAQQRAFDYDPLGFLRSESHPELGRRAGGAQRRLLLSQYDALGNVGRRTVEDGPTLDFFYDLAGRPTQVREGSGRLLKELFYARTNDGVFNRRAGKLAMTKRHNYVPDPSSNFETDLVITETFRYGGRDGLLSEIGIRSSRGPHFQQRYELNQLALEKQIDLPTCSRPPCVAAVGSGRRIEQTFQRGKLIGIREVASGSLLAQLAYHPTGLVQSVSHGNGVLDTLDQDDSGMARPRLMKSQPVTGGTDLWSAGPFAYDGSGNITAIGGDTFDYDRVGRLTNGVVQGSVQQAAYDPYGNLTSLVTGGSDANLQVDPATNRLSMPGVSYDSSGNLTTFSGISGAAYDPLNRMTTLNASGVKNAFLYNASDNRVATLDAQARETRWTVRRPGDQILADFVEAWDTDTVTLGREYVYRGSSLLASYDEAGAIRHYHLDHLGSTRLTTDGQGVKTGEYVYYPFGELAFSSGDDRFLFTGHERDFNRTTETMPENDDLDYMLARFYAPRFGRFLSVDPVLGEAGIPQSWNRYTYVLNAPVSFIDPTGKALAVAQVSAQLDTPGLLEFVAEKLGVDVGDVSAAGLSVGMAVDHAGNSAILVQFAAGESRGFSPLSSSELSVSIGAQRKGKTFDLLGEGASIQGNVGPLGIDVSQTGPPSTVPMNPTVSLTLQKNLSASVTGLMTETLVFEMGKVQLRNELEVGLFVSALTTHVISVLKDAGDNLKSALFD